MTSTQDIEVALGSLTDPKQANAAVAAIMRLKKLDELVSAVSRFNAAKRAYEQSQERMLLLLANFGAL